MQDGKALVERKGRDYDAFGTGIKTRATPCDDASFFNRQLGVPTLGDRELGPVTAPELRQLRYFITTAEELNFTRAARRLYVVQQSLSGAIAQLEDELGIKLFERTTRRVELTEAGDALLPHARDALAAVDRGIDAVNAVIAGKRGRLRIGLAATSGLALTPELLQQFGDAYPDVQIEVRHFDFNDPSGGLEDGWSDVAIVRPPFSGASLSILELETEPRYAVFGSAHRLASETTLQFDQIATEPWMGLETDPVWCAFWQVDERRDTPTPIGAHCTSFDEMFEAARSLRAIGLVPESVAHAQRWPGLRFIPVVDIPPSVVVIAWRIGDERSAVSNFVRLAAQLRP
jgi:DNA-binding transcriptional LysR family regulator